MLRISLLSAIHTFVTILTFLLTSLSLLIHRSHNLPTENGHWDLLLPDGRTKLLNNGQKTQQLCAHHNSSLPFLHAKENLQNLLGNTIVFSLLSVLVNKILQSTAYMDVLWHCLIYNVWVCSFLTRFEFSCSLRQYIEPLNQLCA